MPWIQRRHFQSEYWRAEIFLPIMDPEIELPRIAHKLSSRLQVDRDQEYVLPQHLLDLEKNIPIQFFLQIQVFIRIFYRIFVRDLVFREITD